MSYYQQESDRLRYRKLTDDDVSTWLEFFDNNDRLNFLGMDLSKGKETLAKEWILTQLERYDTSGLGHLAIILKSTGELVGLAGIIPRELEGRKEYEIAYSIKPKHWKKGFATEASQALKEYGIKNIKADRFISIIALGNEDSIKVALKNGMKALFKTTFLEMNVEVYGIENQ